MPAGVVWRSFARNSFREPDTAINPRVVGVKSRLSASAKLEHDAAPPDRFVEPRTLLTEQRDAVADQLGEKIIEVDEMTMQHAFGDSRLFSHRATGESARRRPVSSDALCRGEQCRSRDPVARFRSG